MVSQEIISRGRSFHRIPRHVGLIPDGNRRWARARGMSVAEGYIAGAAKGLQMLTECMDLGISEVSVYGFTQDNTKRPSEERVAFSRACVEFAHIAEKQGIALLVVGDTNSPLFPEELRPFAYGRKGDGLKVNMLVNYDWEWDLRSGSQTGKQWTPKSLASSLIPRIDMIVRWGGCRRLSGFLPVQSVYSEFYVVQAYWPDYELDQFLEALDWYQNQEATLGG